MMPHKDGYKPVVSFVIPVHNQCDKTIKCLLSIRTNISTPYEIVWVDNGSSSSEFNIIKRQAVKPRVHTKLVRFRSNVGFVKATNAGIKEAEGEYIILLNNDTEVGWELADKLIRPFKNKAGEKIGAVGPITNSRIAWQGIDHVNTRWKFSLPRFNINEDIKKYSLNLEKKFKNKYIGVDKLPLSFFCCCIKKSTFEELGMLDESFGIGLGDDDDFNLRLRANGYKQFLSLDAFCFHHHRTTFKALHLSTDSIRRHNVKVLRSNAKKYKIEEQELRSKVFEFTK